MISITSLASLALLLTASYVVDAAAANLTADQVRTLQTNFRANHASSARFLVANAANSGDLFATADNFRRHTSDLFTDLTAQHYRTLILRLNALPDAQQRADAYSHITKNDINVIQKNRANCAAFANYVHHFDKNTIGAMNWECLDQVLNHLPHDKLQHIGASAFKDGMLRVVQRTIGGGGAGSGVFAHLTEQHINAIVSSKDETVWRAIHIRQLTVPNITKHTAKFAALGKEPRAFGKFDGHTTFPLPQDVLRRLPDNIYAKVKVEVHADTIKNMTRKQLAHFGANRKGLGKCSNLKIGDVAPAALAQIKPDCYASYLANVQNKTVDLGKNFGKLVDGVFSDIKDFLLFEKLNSGDWLGMRRPHFDGIVKNHPEACQFVPSELADSNTLGHLRPTPLCFKLLPAAVQTGLLAKHLKDMPEDILSGVSSDKFADWYHNKGNTFAFVEAIKLEPKYLVHLGSAVDPSDNPCILFDNKADLLASKHWMKHMGPHCFSSLTILSEFDEKDMKEFPERVYALSSTDVIQKNAPGFFTKVDSVTMGLMIKGGNFCAQADPKTIASIPAAAFSAMTYKCMQDMKKNVSAITEAQLAFLTEETVKAVDAEVAKSFSSVAAFKPAQLKVLNATAFSAATKQVVAKLTAEQLAVLSAEQLASIPAAAFAGFTTKDQIAAIRPEALVKIVFEQIKEVKEEALLTLSPAQIRSLGKSVTDASKKPAKIFTRAFIAKLPTKEAAEAAKEVAIDNGAASLHVSAGALVVMGAAALLF